MADRPRILILSASAGNGHTRAGQALEKAARQHDAPADVKHLDALAFTNKVFRDLYATLYIETVKKAPLLWAWAFDETNTPWQKTSARLRLQRMNSQPLVREIEQYNPDITVCTHFMPADIVAHMLRTDRIDTHLSVTVTDYYVHATWLSDLFSRYFVAKEESKVQLQMLGFPGERLSVHGIPIDPRFSEDFDRKALYRKHEIETDQPVILLSAGAFGVTPPEDIKRMLDTITTPCQIVIICGHNDNLRNHIQKLVKERKDSAPRYHVLGFTDEMHELMQLADLLIGKPGGLTSSECMACGLPMIIWEPIPGQELFNTAHLLEQGAAAAPDAAVTLGYTVDQLLNNPDRMASMKTAARNTGCPHAARDIINTLVQCHQEPVIKVRKRLV